LTQLYSAGDEIATEKLASAVEIERKRKSFENTLSKKAAKAADRYKLDMENRRSQIGGKIKTLSEDIKRDIIKGIEENVSNKSLVRQILKEKRKIFDTELSKATDEEVKKQIKEKIREIYDKYKYKVERAVRTEALNSSARASLIKYKDLGIKEVSLLTSHDPKVCPKCRNLERSKRTWDVDKLLVLGQYPLSSITHPQCRCTFHPVTQELDYSNDIGKIKNVPKNETESVKRLSKEIEFISPIEFTDDITKHPRFMEHRIEYYRRKGNSLAKAKMLAENDREKLSGKVTHLTTGTGKNTKVLLDSKADKDERFAYLISKINGKRLWERKSSKKEIRPEINDMFKNKKFERTKMKGPKKLLFNRKARETAKQYFIEAYAHYIVHPEVLKEIDPEIYKFIKDSVFKGREFINFSI